MLIVLVGILMMGVGCRSDRAARKLDPPGMARPSPAIEQSAETLGHSSNVIFAAAAKIGAIAKGILTKTSEPDTRASSAAIGTEVSVIEGQAPVTANAVAGLKSAVPDIKEIETLAANSQQVIAKLRSKNNVLLTKSLSVLILTGTVLVAISIFLFITGNPKAMAGGIAGGALIVTAMAVTVLTKLTTLFVCIAGAGVVAIVGALIYHGYDYYKQQKGLRQVVQSVELIKGSVSQVDKDLLFGTKSSAGSIQTLQDPDTKALVKEIKTDLKK